MTEPLSGTSAHRARVVVPVDGEPIADGAVIVRDGLVLAVGPADELLPAHPGARVREWDGTLTPGLVNAHTHLCFSAYADFYGNGLAFPEWIQGFARQNPSMTPEDWRASTADGVARSIAAGVTAVSDVVTPAASFEVLLSSDLRGTAFYEVVGADDSIWAVEGPVWTAALEAAIGQVGGGMTVGVSPHTLFTLSTSVQVALLALARERKLRLHPHVAESPAESLYVHSGSGPFAEMVARIGWQFEILASGGTGHSPTLQNEVLGALGEDCHVAHGVHTDAADRAALRRYNTAVALCARSNARLECGRAPVADYRAEGNLIAVGTDSLASAPDLDILGELPVLREMALSQGSGEEDLDRWLFTAATAGGARALGGFAEYGTITPGKRADFAVFAAADARAPYAALVNEGAGTCVATAVGGRIVHGG
ncbi:amidohydrolase family protein [Phytomonospora endophytica]|uniref:Cytosine/adenosine deaminase-related metal-dependent hydrolase n=1 Tax=Phytomonospora endophytica TaxID=714109 RepID=A0A841FQH4_9ACTN|nr:amidohydrolase family protein [Phytomonospora endophytica]MBB6037083.1 cytosine/adenosine deaminase-related metal-dependent hydrolase [Phytomonospora endophytica]GIG69375.1 cytosine deaminase [Phytomonospora endophytica]